MVADVVSTPEFLPFGSSWEWYHPVDGLSPSGEDADFESTWYRPDVYDGPAFQGPDKALLGYGVIDWGEIQTDIGAPLEQERFSAYFRTTFTLPREQALLEVELLADDGGVLYIDGEDVGRVNFSGSAGHEAFTDQVGIETDTVTLQVPGPFEAGTHEIAFALHNVSTTSSDLGFDLRVSGQAVRLTGKTRQQGDEVSVSATSVVVDTGESRDVEWVVELHGDDGLVVEERGFGQPQEQRLETPWTPEVTELRLFLNDEPIQTIGRDRDGDGMDDAFETVKGFDPDEAADGMMDRDADGLNNTAEFEIGTDVSVGDTDEDGLLDGVETNTGRWLSAVDTGTDPLLADSDGDGLLDGMENPEAVAKASDPNVADTDGDRFDDGLEVSEGTDPSDLFSRPASGTSYFGPHFGRFVEIMGPDDLHLDPDTLAVAVNFNGEVDQVVNGVLFQADGLEPGATVTTNPTTGVTVRNSAQNVFGFTPVPQFEAQDQASGEHLAAMVSSTRWEPASTPIVIDLEGLRPGAVYEVQFLMNDPAAHRYFDLSVEGELIVDNATTRGEAPDAAGQGGQTWTPFNSFAYIGEFEAPLDGELNFVLENHTGGEDPLGSMTEVGSSTMIVHELAPQSFQITEITRSPDGAHLELTWDSLSGLLYQIEASDDLQRWETVMAGIASQGRATSASIENEAGPHPQRYFRVREFALIYENFEGEDGGWIAETVAGETVWELGSLTDVEAGGTNDGQRFWGTNLGSEYTEESVASLRSPMVDLGSVTHAVTLSFRYWVDTVEEMEGGLVRILDASGKELYTHMPPITGQSGGWQPFFLRLPDAVQDGSIQIEFLFQSDGDASVGGGWHVDDVVLR